MSRRLTPSSMYGDYPTQLAHFTRVRPDGCWEFTGYIVPTGYGQLGQNIRAHRLAWELANGRPVPEGLVIDHLCHNADPDCRDNAECFHRRCVNPDHLEPVTSAVNILRGKGFAPANAEVTHCPEGHEYTPQNTYYRPDRHGRLCRTCRHQAGERFAEANRQLLAQRAAEWRRRQAPESFAIREWAIANGLQCSMHGPISRAVRLQYEAAHQRLARAG